MVRVEQATSDSSPLTSEHAFGAAVTYQGNATIIAGELEESDGDQVETFNGRKWIHSSSLPISTSEESKSNGLASIRSLKITLKIKLKTAQIFETLSI